MQKISGKKHSAAIYDNIKKFVEEKNYEHPPTLAFFLIGNRNDSRTYVNIKKKTCTKLGFRYHEFLYDETVSFETLQTKIHTCNQDPNIHGIMLQCPLPSHINENAIMNEINPLKDIDGFNSRNVQYLLQNVLSKKMLSDNPLLDQCDDKLDSFHYYPCTPLGIMTLISRENINVKGKRTTIVGCGRVGRPLSMMLLQYGAVPTLCNSSTNHLHKKNLETIVKNSEIVIVCTGLYNIVNPEWFADNTIVIDVGVQYVNDKLTGELDREKLDKCNVLATPVPGGVGPMTVAMLMSNLALSWHLHNRKE